MSDKDLETIITEILASAQPIGTSDKHELAGRRMQAGQRDAHIVRRLEHRPPRNPLYISLRMIILGLVILLVPLLFAAKRVQPPRSTITGAVDAVAPDQTAVIQLVEAQLPASPLTVAAYDAYRQRHAVS